ncbi:U11/U12 small nuclear ribonucleoprotein 25 kDa protein [Marchantia polymorpha subsp. ruderalis]
MLLNLRKADMGSSGYYQRTGQFEPLLAALLDDPVLADVPKKPTVADIDKLIGVELGSAMKLSILKMDNTSFDVAVLNTASVRELKAELEKKVDSMEQGQLGHRHISWKHVWGNFCLTYNNEKLLNDDALLREFGIKNNDQLHFARHIPSREADVHSRAKKRRFFHGLRKSISFNSSSTIRRSI